MSHKLDPRLHRRLHALHDEGETGGEGESAQATARVTVFVTFEGDLAPLRSAGLQVEMVSGEIALGNVAVADLGRLAEADGVVSIRPETQHRPHLNASVPATHADHVRTGALGLTGAGVVVGIVDSGIDVFHHCFLKPDGTTRILSLLDMSIAQSNTIWLNGTPTGGTFSLSWTPPGSTTGSVSSTIPFNATAAQVQAALVGLPGGIIAAGDITVSGGPLPSTPVTVDFGGRYANQTIGRMGDGGSSLTGGASPALIVVPGKVFSASDINSALPHPEQPFPSTDPADSGHGTHVAGIAAGNGSQAGNCHGQNTYIGVAPQADLAVVKTTFGSSDNPRGVAFAFLVAANQSPAKAAVANLSLGGEFGAHDGTADDEQMLNGLLLDGAGQPLEGRAIVVSSGNDGAITDSSHPNQWKLGLHAHKTVAPNGTATFSLQVPAGDHSADSLSLWYDGAARLTLTVSAPGGGAPGPAVPAPVPPAPGATAIASSTFPLAGCSVTVDAIVNDTPKTWPGTSNPRVKHRFGISIAPPAPPTPPAAGTAPTTSIAAGAWTLTVQETAGTGTDVNAWIDMERTDENAFFAPADQARAGTLTVPATAANVITVGSYDYRDNTLAWTSSRGPTADGRRKPDLCAPGVGIFSAKNRERNTSCWCDCCHDFYVEFSGTSMAAPHITGIVALIFQRNRHLTFDQVRAHLTSTAAPPDPITGPTLPNNDWGAGIVDAEAAVAGVPAAAQADQPVIGAGVAGTSVPLPRGATWPIYIPTARRINALRMRVRGDPAGLILAALVSTHYDEVNRLINTNRRMLIVWHRMGGPQLLGHLMRFADGAPLQLPAVASRRPLVEWLEQMVDLLGEYGSPALQADVMRYRGLVLNAAHAWMSTPAGASPRRLAS